MRLSLPCHPPKLAAVIGGGGKTTLLFKLGRQLAASGAAVLLTTTTHLAWPPPADVAFCAPSAPEELAAAARPGTLVLAGYPAESEKMVGLSPEFLVAARRSFGHVLCEADGSRRLPLKWLRQGQICSFRWPGFPRSTGPQQRCCTGMNFPVCLPRTALRRRILRA